MEDNLLNPQVFYAAQGQISDPGENFNLLNDFPEDLPGLVSAIQGVMLHLHWASRLGITLNGIRKDESNIRTIRDRLAKIIELSDTPLNQERLLTKKTVGTCRDFALLLASVLRQRGIPARCRAGFGTYFIKGHYEDHWVCEYWDSGEARWVMVDPQLDPLQIEVLNISFDPLDIPPGMFVNGAQAWKLCRAKQADPNLFGIFEMKGLDFVKGNLVRDFLALNKVEILPWDNFMMIRKSFSRMKKDEKALMDRMATIATGENRDFILLRAAYAANQSRLLPSYFIK